MDVHTNYSTNKASPDASVMPLNPIYDVNVPIEDSTPLEAFVEEVEETHYYLQKMTNAIVNI